MKLKDKVYQIVEQIQVCNIPCAIYLLEDNTVDVAFIRGNLLPEWFINHKYKRKIVGQLSIKFIFLSYKTIEERVDALYEEIMEELK